MGVDVVIVIGAARSGTSCVSGVLERLGVNFDDGALLDPTPFNPLGYFESQVLNDALDQQVQALRGAWQPMETPLVPSVVRYLQHVPTRRKPVGVKDTRLVSCGLPFAKYLDLCDLDVRIVTTSRAGAANAMSLRSWHEPGPASTLSRMLRTHLSETEKGLRDAGFAVLQVSYEQLLRYPERHTKRLAKFIGAPVDRVEHAAQFVDPKLNHHGKAKTV